MKNISLKQVIALSLTIIILTAISAYSAIMILNHYNSKKIDNNLSSAPNIEDKDGNNIEGNLIDMPEEIFINKIPLAADSNAIEGVSTTLKATITPSDAANQTVYWSIEWITPNELDVNDYIKLTVSPTDTKIVTVTCKNAFSNNIILITVTTNDGEYKASTKAIFKGYAETITTNIPSLINHNLFKEQEFNITINNRFNTINYTPNFEISLKGVNDNPIITQSYKVVDNENIQLGLGIPTQNGTVRDGLVMLNLNSFAPTMVGNRCYLGTSSFLFTRLNGDKIFIRPLALMKNSKIAIPSMIFSQLPPDYNDINADEWFLQFSQMNNGINESDLDKYILTIKETVSKIELSITFKFI